MNAGRKNSKPNIGIHGHAGGTSPDQTSKTPKNLSAHESEECGCEESVGLYAVCMRERGGGRWGPDDFVVYYESLKRALKTKTIYGYRCDERLKTNVEESTRLVYTPLCVELEHLKIETRLRDERFESVKGECVI